MITEQHALGIEERSRKRGAGISGGSERARQRPPRRPKVEKEAGTAEPRLIQSCGFTLVPEGPAPLPGWSGPWGARAGVSMHVGVCAHMGVHVCTRGACMHTRRLILHMAGKRVQPLPWEGTTVAGAESGGPGAAPGTGTLKKGPSPLLLSPRPPPSSLPVCLYSGDGRQSRDASYTESHGRVE